MYIIIEHCSDGCFEPVQFIGAYETHEDTVKAMHERVAKVEKSYTDWRGIPFDPHYTEDEDDFASRGYEGDGWVFDWFVFNTDEPYISNGYA